MYVSLITDDCWQIFVIITYVYDMPLRCKRLDGSDVNNHMLALSTINALIAITYSYTLLC